MNRKKLGTCAAAMMCTILGATYLASPIQAATMMKMCSPDQQAYAQGYADGACGGPGTGTVSSCSDAGGGASVFSWHC